VKSPITDAIATLFIMLTIIAGGYFYLRYEAVKVLQHKEERKLNSEQKYEKRAVDVDKSTMEKYAPKSFEALSKRTE